MADDSKEEKKKEEQQSSNLQVFYDIDLSIPSIIAALHQKAIGSAEKKASDIRIANSAIESDGKTAKLNSAGLHIISVLSTKEGEEAKIKKSDALVALKEYVTWFVGPDLANKVTDKVILPLGNGEDENKQDLELNEQSLEQNEESPKEEQKEENDNEKPDEKNESIEVKSFKKFLMEDCGLKILLEADPTEPGEDPDGPDQEDYDQESDDAESEAVGSNDEKTKLEDNKEEKKEDEGTPSAPGWYIAYDLKVQGLKESSLKDAMKQFATKFFDNLTITASGLFGGGDKFTGKDIRKGLHDLMHVDHEKLASDVDSYIKKKFPNIENSEVKTRDKNTLLKELKLYLTPDQKEAISNAEYSLWIKIKEEDRKKPFMNTLKIADVIRKCMAFFRIGKKASITKDSIIKIEDFKDKNDPDTIKNNAKRPSASSIEELIKNDKYKPNAKGMIEEYTVALNLYNEILKRFKSIENDKKASQEKENKDALAILNKLKEQWKKQKDQLPVDKKIFDDFYDEYLKFETSTNESISFSFIDKANIEKMILEMLFEDVDILPLKVFEADENERNEDKNDNAPNYSEMSGILKKAAVLLKGLKYATAVLGKENTIQCLLNAEYDVSLIKSDLHKNFAIIDFHPNSIIEERIGESIESKIVNMLFEADPTEPGKDPDGPDQEDYDQESDDAESETDKKEKENSNDENKQPEESQDKTLIKIENIFKDFTKKANIADDQVGKTIILEVEIDDKNKNESISKNQSFILITEAKDLVTQVENDLGTNATKLGKTAMKQKGLHNTYPIKVGTSEDVVKYLQQLKVGSSKDFEKMKLKKYSAALVIKQSKEEGETTYGGAHGNSAFTNDAVKKECFLKSFDDSNNFEYTVISGTTPASKETRMQYNKDGKYKVPVDIKVFVASFDENVKDESDADKPKPEPTKTEEKKNNKVKAYILPFDIVEEQLEEKKDEDHLPTPKPGNDENIENDKDSKNADGTDLYIYPIASSKDFEEGKEARNN